MSSQAKYLISIQWKSTRKTFTEKLQAEKIEAAKTADEDKVVAKVIENATMEIPDQMVEEQVNGMVNDYARRLESQGISFKQYVEITGMTAEKIGEQMKPQAIKRNSDKTCSRGSCKG